MLALIVSAMLAAPTMDTSRHDLVLCLREAAQTAKPSEVKPDDFPAYAKGQCSGPIAAMKSALVSFDVKNGVARGRAASDADLQIDDYVASAKDSYDVRVNN